MKYVIILSLLFLVGCTVQECPTVTCPTCEVEEEIEVTESYIEANIEIPYERVGDKLVIENCGSTAYGLRTADKIRKMFEEDYTLLDATLKITSTDEKYIGGCPDILTEIFEIGNVSYYVKGTNDAFLKLEDHTPNYKRNNYE